MTNQESFYAWLVRQPAAVQNDALGESADDFRAGKIKAKDLPRYEVNEALSLKDFKGKVETILSR